MRLRPSSWPPVGDVPADPGIWPRKRKRCVFRGKPATTRQGDCARGPGMSPPVIFMPNGSLWHVGVATAGRKNGPSLSKVPPATSRGSRPRTRGLARQAPPGHQTPSQVARLMCAWLRRFTTCRFYAKRLPVEPSPRSPVPFSQGPPRAQAVCHQMYKNTDYFAAIGYRIRSNRTEHPGGKFQTTGHLPTSIWVPEVVPPTSFGGRRKFG